MAFVREEWQIVAGRESQFLPYAGVTCAEFNRVAPVECDRVLCGLRKMQYFGGLVAGEIIRLGDRTSHNGTVIEGSQLDICMGKPIAYIGHNVQCPKCKGTFPIVEGAMTTTFYGKGVALAGMKTSCGAVLIAGQFTDTVDWGRGRSVAEPAAGPSSRPGAEATEDAALAESTAVENVAESSDQLAAIRTGTEFDEQFLLVDEENTPLAKAPYTVRLASGELVRQMTDERGMTARYATGGEEMIEVYLGH